MCLGSRVWRVRLRIGGLRFRDCRVGLRFWFIGLYKNIAQVDANSNGKRQGEMKLWGLELRFWA